MCLLAAFVLYSVARKMDQLQENSIKKFQAYSVTDSSVVDTLQWQANPGTSFVPFKPQDTVSINLSGEMVDSRDGEFQYVIIKQIK